MYEEKRAQGGDTAAAMGRRAMLLRGSQEN